MSISKTLKVVLFFFVALAPFVAGAQQPGATVHGLVADPDDAVIPGATVTLTPASGKALTTQSQSDGTYTLRGMPAGTYSLTVTMPGFASFVKLGVKISAGQALTVDAKMAIQEQSQVVQVTAQSAQVSVDQDSNASSTVIKGKDLDALSDDPDELSSELTALAGPAAGPNGGQIYVDGFTGGQLPPKSSIREIRINQNPFSAQYDRLGYGRVEIFTKPGTDKFHGSFQTNGNDSAFNGGNPLSDVTQPPYHTIFLLGNLTGPISKIASFSLAGSHRDIQDNALVNANILVPNTSSTVICPPGIAGCVVVPYFDAVPIPQTRSDISPRVDLQLGEKNTLTTRFQYEQNDLKNQNISDVDLPSTGYNSHSSEATIQMSDTQIVNAHVINETRFEVQRDYSTQTALSTAPTVSVQGSFTNGGYNGGSASDHQLHFEVQNYTSVQLQKNFIRFGGRLRTTRDANSTTGGTNGQFTYASLTTYQENTPSQYSITQVNGPATATVVDLGLYAEDDWRALPNLTLSYGIRYETQNHLSDHHDFAPRVSFAYGLGNAKNSPKTVLRGGFGMFYDRYTLPNILTTEQLNGVDQIKSTIVNPGSQCTPVTNPPNCGTSGLTTYAAASNLRSPYTMQFAIGVDQQLFRGATVSVNYLNAHGVHEFVSENVNSPTYNSSTGQFTYPVPGVGGGSPPIMDQYQSEGVFRQNQLITNINMRGSRYFSIFGYYVLNFAKSDTGGINSFVSTPYNIGADYGRATFDTRNRLFLGGSVNLPYLITMSPFLVAASGAPFNITTGSDLNRDGQFNDRPAYASSSTLPGDLVVNKYGSFDTLAPQMVGGVLLTPNINVPRIPVNLATAPALFTMNLRVMKTFGFGPLTGPRVAQGDQGPQGGPGGRGGPGGGRGGSGGGGGRGGGGGFGGGGASSGRRFNLSLGATFQNLFNYTDVSTPKGILTSPNFGVGTQLAGGIYSSNSALRRITLQATFTF